MAQENRLKLPEKFPPIFLRRYGGFFVWFNLGRSRQFEGKLILCVRTIFCIALFLVTTLCQGIEYSTLECNILLYKDYHEGLASYVSGRQTADFAE